MGDSDLDHDSTAPRVATKLLQRVCEPTRLEEIAGDLLEIYQRDCARIGRRRAAVRYSLQVAIIAMHVVPRLLRTPRIVLGWEIYPSRVIAVLLAALGFLRFSGKSLMAYLLVFALAPELLVVCSVIPAVLRRVLGQGRR